MKIGYARVSTLEQNLDLQPDALKASGCEKIMVEKASGSKQDCSALEQMREQLRKGDVLVVWRLDRLGRSLKHLIELMSELEEQGIGFQSVTEAIDTATPGGKLIFHIFGALAEFERNLIRERTRGGPGPRQAGWQAEEEGSKATAARRSTLPREDAYQGRNLRHARHQSPDALCLCP